MLSQLRPALLATITFTVLTGLVYPLTVTGIAQVFFRNKANGSLITRKGSVVGSVLIGQNFSAAAYFHPRPSASGSTGYDAFASGGSNLGPTNPDLTKRLGTDAAAYRTANGATGPIPADAVTTSGSGLDPDISPANARLQVARIAAARHADPAQIRALLDTKIQGRDLGFLGEPRVNVLALNLALDEKFPFR